MLRPSHSSRFCHQNNIGWAVQIVELIIMQYAVRLHNLLIAASLYGFTSQKTSTTPSNLTRFWLIMININKSNGALGIQT
jgi:hypothetical protein